METNLTIKNFRVFDDQGVTVEIAPLTFLVGCNSSGKSSIVKALMLLDSYLTHINNYDGEKEPHFDFSSDSLASLGNLESAINKKSSSVGDQSCSFSYTYYSAELGRLLSVEWTFSVDKEDDLKRDQLQSLVVTSNNMPLFQASSFDDLKSYLKKGLFIKPSRRIVTNSLKNTFISFLYTIMQFDDDVPEIIPQLNSVFLLQNISPLAPNMTLEWLEHIQNEEFFYRWYNHEHEEAIEHAARTGILFYLPILNQLDTITKTHFKSDFLSLLDKSYRYPKTIIKIIDSFIDSAYECFSDYYRKLEDEYLNNNGITDGINRYLYQEDQSDGLIFNNNHFIAAQCEPDADKHLFEILFLTLCDIEPSLSSYVKERGPCYHHFLNDDLYRYLDSIIENIIRFDICQDISFISSSRALVKRAYLLGNDEFSNIISNFLENKRTSKKWMNEKDYHPGTFLNRWINKFEIGRKVEFKSIGEGLGFTIVFYDSDNNGRILADLGYGISQLISILIEIETAITTKKGRNDRKTIAIEEPEIHLHPKFQSLLAEMFFEAYKQYGIQFIIETHSEYLLRKIQTLIADKNNNLTPEEVSMIYVEDEQEVIKGKPKIRRIHIQEDGCLAEPFGHRFYDEADRLAMDLLRIKLRNDE